MEYPLFQEDIEILKFSHYPYLPESRVNYIFCLNGAFNYPFNLTTE